MSTPDTEPETPALPSHAVARRHGVPRWAHLSTAGKVITASATTAAALVAIVSGVLNVQSRVSSDVISIDGAVTVHDVRFEEAMIPAQSTAIEGVDASTAGENRITFTVVSSGNPGLVQVEYALFAANTFRRLAAGDQNEVWGQLELKGESNINLWIDVPVEPGGRCIFARIYVVPVMDPKSCIPECAPIARWDVADSLPFDSRTGTPCWGSN